MVRLFPLSDDQPVARTGGGDVKEPVLLGFQELPFFLGEFLPLLRIGEKRAMEAAARAVNRQIATDGTAAPVDMDLGSWLNAPVGSARKTTGASRPFAWCRFMIRTGASAGDAAGTASWFSAPSTT